MSEPKTCPECAAPLRATALAGLCPACVAKFGFGFDDLADETAVVEKPDRAGQLEPALVRYFGDYEIRSEIARGGMGVVYRARQMTLNRDVALKMVAGGLTARDEDLKRFRTEAEAAARLDHPNIVSIYEFGTHEGGQYFTMQFVDGESLDRRIAGFVGQPRAAVALVIKVAHALHYAHQRGVLHRDVKPGNILLDEFGEPHVTDFGLAKLLEDNAQLTVSGAILGSPAYMAPEQASGGSNRVTAATDTYGLGAVLYHLLTGSPPFRGKSPMEVVAKVRDAEPARPTTLNAELDPVLEAICLKCLAKEPGSRYGSANELAEALEIWAGQPEHSIPAVKRRSETPALMVLAALVLFGGWWFWQPSMGQFVTDIISAPETPTPEAPLPAIAAEAGSADQPSLKSLIPEQFQGRWQLKYRNSYSVDLEIGSNVVTLLKTARPGFKVKSFGPRPLKFAVERNVLKFQHVNGRGQIEDFPAVWRSINLDRQVAGSSDHKASMGNGQLRKLSE